MAIKQSCTFYSDFKIKTDTEYVNGIETVYKEYDRQGNVIYLRYARIGEWYKWIYNELGDIIEYSDSTGYWRKSKYNKNGKPTYSETSTDGILLDVKRGIGKPNQYYVSNRNSNSLP